MSASEQRPVLSSCSTSKRLRLALPEPEEAQGELAGSEGVAASSSLGLRRPQWAELPQDLTVLVCYNLGPSAMVGFLGSCRRAHLMSRSEEVWRHFCLLRWGKGANIALYASAKELYRDGNGWFPRRCGRRRSPNLEVQETTLHKSPCLTMDMRMTNEEIVTVSEAAKTQHGVVQQARVHVIDPDTLAVRQQIEVSRSTINCCDVGHGAICLGSDDFKVRIYQQIGRSSPDGSSSSAGSYELASEHLCTSEVNDLRFTREDAIIAVRTHHNRHPAGLDVIPVQRPDTRMSFQGGSLATRGKFIHALDGFEDGCSLSCIACSGEDAITSAFSAMLFDFRRSAPCVVDLPVTSQSQGHPHATMLWPLRAGRAPQVYANLLDEGRHHDNGVIAMVDFRYPNREVADLFHFPDPVDDFRCLDGSIYAACTDVAASINRIRIHRCSYDRPDIERLCTVVEEYDAGGRAPKEDLKVFSISSRGLAMSYGTHLSVGRLAEPLGQLDRADGYSCPAGLRAPRSVRSQWQSLLTEELPSQPHYCSL